MVAVTVAVLATFMGICKVKDDNIVQGMQQAQADKLDYWGFYQARNLRQEIAQATVEQLKLARARAAGGGAARPTTPRSPSTRRSRRARTRRRTDLQKQAEEAEKTYDALNFRDDQFDLSDALARDRHRPARGHRADASLVAVLAGAACRPCLGLATGIAGLAALGIHPDLLIKPLT